MIHDSAEPFHAKIRKTKYKNKHLSEKNFVETEDAEPQGPPKRDLWSRHVNSDLVKGKILFSRSIKEFPVARTSLYHGAKVIKVWSSALACQSQLLFELTLEPSTGSSQVVTSPWSALSFEFQESHVDNMARKNSLKHVQLFSTVMFPCVLLSNFKYPFLLVNCQEGQGSQNELKGEECKNIHTLEESFGSFQGKMGVKPHPGVDGFAQVTVGYHLTLEKE
ncbi:hypothetical protein HGM15179_001776 [Zosterops borbonicus]|uniref:Uncharacterized protein n=1 Tax=Zosterops borbonicus TaxID=364589 RepID=A0A8K1GXA2_9PASS|nr:hypothetical protein HGM15179_001776 [Zosterops borbonicus]